jgi:hypothetical protein
MQQLFTFSNGLLLKHIQVDLGRGLGTKPTPFNLLSLANFEILFKSWSKSSSNEILLSFLHSFF